MAPRKALKLITRGKLTFGERVVLHHMDGANTAHVRQSRPDSGLGFQVKVLTTFYLVPTSLGSGDLGG